MTMTHYMELLATNQPWNLILYMVIPVVLAEYIAVSELYILFTRNKKSLVKKLNEYASILLGFYFLGIVLYLFQTAVIPLTTSGSWRGVADIIAVGFYLLGVIPLFGMALLQMGIIKKHASAENKLKLHAIFVGCFLVIAHIAMIFGMLNPQVLGWHETMSHSSTKMQMKEMEGMNK